MEEETGLEITEESVTQTELQELVGRMEQHLAPPTSTNFKEDFKEGII